MSNIKQSVLLSVQKEQGVELFTGDLVIGPGNGFAVVPGSVKRLALKAIPITRDMVKESKKRNGTARPAKKAH
jgi:hypothetical protein